MSYVEFYKYHGAGNDFILIDNRSGTLTVTTETIAHWCHRNYGVGADGLMLLKHLRWKVITFTCSILILMEEKVPCVVMAVDALRGLRWI